MKPEECGIVAVKGMKRYITETREISKGRSAGWLEVKLVNGRKEKVMRDQVLREVCHDHD